MAEADAGLKGRVLNMHTIKPVDEEAVMSAIMDTRRIITVEDHEVMGGLGSAVAEVVAKSGKACAFKMLGHQNAFSTIGLQEDLLAMAKIDANGINEAIAEMMHADFEPDDAWDDEFIPVSPDCFDDTGTQLAPEFVDHAGNPGPAGIKGICCDGFVNLPSGKYLPRVVG